MLTLFQKNLAIEDSDNSEALKLLNNFWAFLYKNKSMGIKFNKYEGEYEYGK